MRQSPPGLAPAQSQVALEAVHFQNGDFFRALAALFAQAETVPLDDLPMHSVGHDIIACVKKFTGMTIDFKFDQYMPCVEFPSFDKGNVLFTGNLRYWSSSDTGLKMIRASSDGLVRGSVNLITGQVSGAYAEHTTTIHMPAKEVVNKWLSPEQWAAVTLHEIGHVFVYFEYLNRTISTNQALAGMTKALDQSDTVEEREVVFMAVKKALELTELDVEALTKASNNRIVEAVVISELVREVTSELGSNLYDTCTWEYLADQYAMRQGSGRHLGTALDKLFGGQGMSYRSGTTYVIVEAFKVICFVASIAAFASTMGFSLLFTLAYISGDDSGNDGDGMYDRPEARIQRMRAQVVQNLKDPQLSARRRKDLAEDIAALDVILSRMKDRDGWFTQVYHLINFSARRQRDQERMQKQLEDIATNDLFVKASALRTLA